MKKRLPILIVTLTLLLTMLAIPTQAAITEDPLSWFVKGGSTGRGSGFQYNEADGTLYAWGDKGGSMMLDSYDDSKGDSMLDSDMLLRTKNGITTPPNKEVDQDYYMTDFGWTFDYMTLKNEWIQDRAMFRSREETEWASYMLLMGGSNVTEHNAAGLSLMVGGSYDILAHVDFTFETGVKYRVKIQMIQNVIKVWFYKASEAMPAEPTLQATVNMEQNYCPSGDFQWVSWGGNCVLSNMAIGSPDIVNEKATATTTTTTVTQKPTTTTESKADETTTVADTTTTTDGDETAPTDDPSAGGDTSSSTTASTDSTSKTYGDNANVNAGNDDEQEPSSVLPIVLVVCGLVLVGGAVAAWFVLKKSSKAGDTKSE